MKNEMCDVINKIDKEYNLLLGWYRNGIPKYEIVSQYSGYLDALIDFFSADSDIYSYAKKYFYKLLKLKNNV